MTLYVISHSRKKRANFIFHVLYCPCNCINCISVTGQLLRIILDCMWRFCVCHEFYTRSQLIRAIDIQRAVRYLAARYQGTLSRLSRVTDITVFGRGRETVVKEDSAVRMELHGKWVVSLVYLHEFNDLENYDYDSLFWSKNIHFQLFKTNVFFFFFTPIAFERHSMAHGYTMLLPVEPDFLLHISWRMSEHQGTTN